MILQNGETKKHELWMKPPEKLPNQQTCSMLCIYKYKYQYIIFHCHPPIGLVATPVCLNPSQANSTDAPSGDGWQYIYICIYCLLFIPFCCCWVDVPFVSSKSAPTTQVSSGVTRGHRWRSQWWPVEIPTNKNEVFNWLPFCYISPGCHAWYMTT